MDIGLEKPLIVWIEHCSVVSTNCYTRNQLLRCTLFFVLSRFPKSF